MLSDVPLLLQVLITFSLISFLILAFTVRPSRQRECDRCSTRDFEIERPVV